MSIHQQLNEAYKHQVLNDFEDNGKFPNTPEGLLDFIKEYDDYIIYHRENPYSKKTTIWQRLNRFWVLPCCLIAMPFTWLATGRTGVNVHGKFGKWLAKITGL